MHVFTKATPLYTCITMHSHLSGKNGSISKGLSLENIRSFNLTRGVHCSNKHLMYKTQKVSMNLF